MIIIIFSENMVVDAFFACLFRCSLFNIFVYGSLICIYLMNILVNWCIGNLCSCNYSFLCSFPSVEYLQKFPKQQNLAFGVQECLMRFSSGFDSVFDYYKSCRTSSKLRYSTFADVTASLVTSRFVLCWCCKIVKLNSTPHCAVLNFS